MKKRIVVLGSTGSVGRNVLDVVAHHPDRFDIVGLTASSNVARLREQCDLHPRAWFCLGSEEAHDALVGQDPHFGGRSVGWGPDALLRLIDRASPDLVVNCVVGFVGLRPTLHALKAGVSVALANKEAIVTGGKILTETSRRSGAHIIPIDSEHVAISQCLRGAEREEIKIVYITASGGALRDKSMQEIGRVTIDDVLAHPTWNMGSKITVDSATLLNKGLEVIEAHWLFDLPIDKIKVVIHPQSIIHSLVEFIDNSILAQMGLPDMRLPILYALNYPERIRTSLVESCITDFPKLDFKQVDETRYPCLRLAMAAAEMQGNAPAILNSANEVAVGAFLAGKIPFSKIHEIIETALENIPHSELNSYEDVLEADEATRTFMKKRFSL